MMPVWVTGEVVKWSLRFCSRRSFWRQRCASFPTKGASFPLDQQSAHNRAAGPSHAFLAAAPDRPVRFYSLDRGHSEDPEEKEHVLSTLPVDTGSRQAQDWHPFEDYLQRCESPSDVLDLTCKKAPSVRQVSSSLTHMWSTTKKMSDEHKRYELQRMFEHPAFETLLQKAMTAVGLMPCKDVAYCLVSLVQLGVPQRSRVVQTVLQTCQKKLNDFDEKGLSILASCLAHMEDGPNVATLKECMRLVVDIRLPTVSNVMALQTMMRLMGKDAPVGLKRKLEGKALSMVNQFSPSNSQYIISTMATMGFYSKPLLDICGKKISENLCGLPFSRVLTVLLSCKELRHRDVALLTGISNYAASMISIWSNRQLILILSVFENLGFCPAVLLEVFAKEVIANPDTLTRKDILCILKVYSSLNYDLQQQRRLFLGGLRRALNPYLSKMSPFELLKVVYYLCLLGHFPPAPLQQLLQGGTLEQFEVTERGFPQNQERMFRTLDLCLRLDRPSLPVPLTVPPFLLGDSSQSLSPGIPWLQQSLRTALADQAGTTLQESVVVERFYFIDGVITKPLPGLAAMPEARQAGDECSPAEGSWRIAVIWVPHPFCCGTSNPRGPLAVKTRHLKILGFDQVLVLQRKLQSMSETERTNFLRRKIFPEHHSADEQPGTEHLIT